LIESQDTSSANIYSSPPLQDKNSHDRHTDILQTTAEPHLSDQSEFYTFTVTAKAVEQQHDRPRLSDLLTHLVFIQFVMLDAL